MTGTKKEFRKWRTTDSPIAPFADSYFFYCAISYEAASTK